MYNHDKYWWRRWQQAGQWWQRYLYNRIVTCSNGHGEDRNNDNDATEMTMVIMINAIVTDHETKMTMMMVSVMVSSMIVMVLVVMVRRRRRMAVLITTKVTRTGKMLCTCFPQWTFHTCGSWATAMQHSWSNQTTRSHLASHTIILSMWLKNKPLSNHQKLICSIHLTCGNTRTPIYNRQIDKPCPNSLPRSAPAVA